jgi:hypothetical protein
MIISNIFVGDPDGVTTPEASSVAYPATTVPLKVIPDVEAEDEKVELL